MVACSFPRSSTRVEVAVILLLLAVLVAVGDRKESAKIMPTPIPTPKMVMAAFMMVLNENCKRLLRTKKLVLQRRAEVLWLGRLRRVWMGRREVEVEAEVSKEVRDVWAVRLLFSGCDSGVGEAASSARVSMEEMEELE